MDPDLRPRDMYVFRWNGQAARRRRRMQNYPRFRRREHQHTKRGAERTRIVRVAWRLRRLDRIAVCVESDRCRAVRRADQHDMRGPGRSGKRNTATGRRMDRKRNQLQQQPGYRSTCCAPTPSLGKHLPHPARLSAASTLPNLRCVAEATIDCKPAKQSSEKMRWRFHG